MTIANEEDIQTMYEIHQNINIAYIHRFILKSINVDTIIIYDVMNRVPHP